MRVKNLTNETQKIEVSELVGEGKAYPIYLQPNGETDIDRTMGIVNPSQYAGILKIEGVSTVAPVAKALATVITSAPVPEVVITTDTEIEADTIAPESVEDLAVASAYVCDVCGAEFASARGLSNHKNKAHK